MTAYTVTLVDTATALEALMPDWTRLFYASAAPNPFAHPLWMSTWARHFVKPSQLYILAVRDAGGELVGVAPFYRKRYALGPLRLTALQLFGTGRQLDLTELPQILTRPGLERPVLRAIMHHISACPGDWSWVEVALTPEQGWFEPQWLPRDGMGAGGFVLHKATRPCVVLPLPATWEELRAHLKRNVKESLRHGANSLKREGHTWQVTAPGDTSALAAALDSLMALHGARAGLRGKVRHPDHFANRADRAFLRDVARRMFCAGHLTPYLMHVDGAVAAARLQLHANGTAFVSCSGFAPQWWPYSVATTTLAEGIKAAITRGDRLVNLSPGPDVAKLRWSEQLQLHQEFIVVGSRRGALPAFALFWLLRAVDLLRRERRRHEDV